MIRCFVVVCISQSKQATEGVCACGAADGIGGAVVVAVFERAAHRDFCACLVFDFAAERGHHVVAVFGLPDHWHADDCAGGIGDLESIRVAVCIRAIGHQFAALCDVECGNPSLGPRRGCSGVIETHDANIGAHHIASAVEQIALDAIGHAIGVCVGNNVQAEGCGADRRKHGACSCAIASSQFDVTLATLRCAAD